MQRVCTRSSIQGARAKHSSRVGFNAESVQQEFNPKKNPREVMLLLLMSTITIQKHNGQTEASRL